MTDNTKHDNIGCISSRTENYPTARFQISQINIKRNEMKDLCLNLTKRMLNQYPKSSSGAVNNAKNSPCRCCLNGVAPTADEMETTYKFNGWKRNGME